MTNFENPCFILIYFFLLLFYQLYGFVSFIFMIRNANVGQVREISLFDMIIQATLYALHGG